MAANEHTGSSTPDKEADRKRRAKEADLRRKERIKARKHGLEGPPLLRSAKPRGPTIIDPDERRLRKLQINRAASAAWRARHAEKHRAITKRYREANREKIKAKDRAYRAGSGADVLRARKHERLKTDIQFKLRTYLSKRIVCALKRGKARKSYATIELIGCSIPQLLAHIERQWLKGMSWKNYGVWQIDHIIALSSADLTVPEEQRRLCHFTNLRPLWGPDNIRKGNERTLLL